MYIFFNLIQAVRISCKQTHCFFGRVCTFLLIVTQSVMMARAAAMTKNAPTEAPAMITTLLLGGTGDGVGVGTVVAAELIRRKYYTLSTIVLPYDIGR